MDNTQLTVRPLTVCRLGATLAPDRRGLGLLELLLSVALVSIVVVFAYGNLTQTFVMGEKTLATVQTAVTAHNVREILVSTSTEGLDAARALFPGLNTATRTAIDPGSLAFAGGGSWASTTAVLATSSASAPVVLITDGMGNIADLINLASIGGESGPTQYVATVSWSQPNNTDGVYFSMW